MFIKQLSHFYCFGCPEVSGLVNILREFVVPYLNLAMKRVPHSEFHVPQRLLDEVTIRRFWENSKL